MIINVNWLLQRSSNSILGSDMCFVLGCYILAVKHAASFKMRQMMTASQLVHSLAELRPHTRAR